MQRVLFIASSGGHYKQLRKLDPLIGKYHGIVITERIRTLEKEKGVRYLHQVNRKEKLFPFWLFVNAVHSFLIFLAVRPDVIVTTGVLCAIPMCLIAKMFKRHVIYIESFAKVITPTETGKFIYRHHLADAFFVQWKSMLDIYPDAVYAGSLY